MRASTINHRRIRGRIVAIAAAAAAAASLASASEAAAQATTCKVSNGVLDVTMHQNTSLRTAGPTIALSANGALTCAGGTPSTQNVDVIRVVDVSDDHATPAPGDGSTTLTVYDPTSFWPGRSPNEQGGQGEIEFVVNMGGGAADTLIALGGYEAPTVWTAGSGGFNWNRDNDPDMYGGPFDVVELRGRDWSDRISARGGDGTGAPLALPKLFLDGGRGGDDELLGGDGPDVIDPGMGDNVVGGFGGDDFIVDRGGNDSHAGGTGTDALSYGGHPRGVSVDLRTTEARDTGAGTDFVADIESVYGTSEADTLIGNAASNVLGGYNGDDVLSGGGGNDLLRGGDDDDTVSYADAPSPLIADLVTRRAELDGEVDSLEDVENLIGSPFADRLTGDAKPNRLVGGAGADTINAADGADRVEIRDGEGDTAGCGDDAATDTLIGDRRGVDTINADCESVEFAPEPEPEQPGGGGGVGPDPENPDRSLAFELSGSRTQRLVAQRAVRVRVACPLEPCSTQVKAAGTLPATRGASKASRRLSLKPVAAGLAAGSTRTVKLRLTSKQLAAVRRALVAKRTATLKVTATARDAAGNSVVRTLRVRVRR